MTSLLTSREAVVTTSHGYQFVSAGYQVGDTVKLNSTPRRFGHKGTSQSYNLGFLWGAIAGDGSIEGPKLINRLVAAGILRPLPLRDTSEELTRGFLISALENHGVVQTGEYPSMNMYHTNVTLLGRMQQMLLDFGIMSFLARKANTKLNHKDAYLLRLSYYQLWLFNKRVGKIPKMQKTLKVYGDPNKEDDYTSVVVSTSPVCSPCVVGTISSRDLVECSGQGLPCESSENRQF